MVKDQAQIEQVSELERWFVSEYHDRFCSVWSKDIESNKLNELDKDKVLWILEILNKHPVNISDLTHQLRDLIYVLSNMVDVSLKMKFPSLIVETLQETEGLTKAYVLFNKDIYSNEALADIQSKIQAFFAGALFAGFSGALYAYFVRYVSTDQFTLWLSVWYVGMLIVGGMHSPFGAMLGVAVITLLQEGVHLLGTKVLSSFTGMSGGTVFSLTNVVLGGVIILMLLFEPLGLAHRWSILKSSYRIWPYPRG